MNKSNLSSWIALKFMIPNSVIEIRQAYWPSWIKNSNITLMIHPSLSLLKVKTFRRNLPTFSLTSVSLFRAIASTSMLNIRLFSLKNWKFWGGPSLKDIALGLDILCLRFWIENLEGWACLGRNSSETRSVLSFKKEKLTLRPIWTKWHV